MLKRLPLVFLVGAVTLSAAPAMAGDDRDDRWYQEYMGKLPLPRAVAIARTQGVVWVNRAEFDDDTWQIEGRDEIGREVTVEIRARDGRILDVSSD